MTAGKGTVLVSSIRTDADRKDPVACRMTHNILSWDFQGIGCAPASSIPETIFLTAPEKLDNLKITPLCGITLHKGMLL